MTERERFEEWWISQNYSGPYDKLMWGKELQLIAWQAALKGGEPVAWGFVGTEGALKGKVYDAWHDKHECTEAGDNLIPLYTSPPNTYTESEVDEMMMKVAMKVYDGMLGDRQRGFRRDGIRAVVDKVKAG